MTDLVKLTHEAVKAFAFMVTIKRIDGGVRIDGYEKALQDMWDADALDPVLDAIGSGASTEMNYACAANDFAPTHIIVKVPR